MSREAETRPYRMRLRAEQQEETRRRITESAVELHGSLGPARTSMSAVAEHARVRRSTLYRHFPDEDALFAACSAHWAQANPPPDPAAWQAIAEPGTRLRVALAELYAFYGGTEGMIANVLRDEPVVEAIGRALEPFRRYWAHCAEVLMAGRRERGAARRRARAAVGHAIAFPTWRSLVRDEGLSDDEAVELMARLVEVRATRSR